MEGLIRQMSISDLVVYPIKGCRGISLKTATICPTGLLHDHTFLIVARKTEDAPYETVTIKQCPALVHVQPSFEASRMRIMYTKTGESILVDLEPEVTEYRRLPDTVKLWVYPYKQPIDLGSEIGRFFRQVVGVQGQDVRLCYRSTEPRTIAGNMPPRTAQGGKKQIEAGLHAAFPLLVASASSLSELNSRFPESHPFEMDRFRANIIIDNLEPWSEDSWLTIDLIPNQGDLRVQRVHITARCGRCVVTTYDLSTSRPGPEPLRELRKYRNIDKGDQAKSPVFGMYGGMRPVFWS